MTNRTKWHFVRPEGLYFEDREGLEGFQPYQQVKGADYRKSGTLIPYWISNHDISGQHFRNKADRSIILSVETAQTSW